MATIQVASDGNWDENQITREIDTISIEDLKNDFQWIMSQVVNAYGDNQEEPLDAA